MLKKYKMKTFTNILIGISFFVLLIFSGILGLRGQSAEMGLSILAGAIGLSFLNIDKIKRFKGAGFEAEMQEKIEAIIEKETEPPQNGSAGFLTCEAYGTDENAKKAIEALNNPKYTWRYLGGIVKDSGLTQKKTLETLNWLLENKLGKMTEGEHGRLWALSAKGRKVFASIKG